MKFSRYNQPKRHNRRNECRQELAGMVILTQKEYEREQNAEAKAFEKFMNSEGGIFDGFAFVNLFHEHFDKRNAIYTTESNDTANAITPFGTFHTGADGVAVYFFSEQPTKQVNFNRSVYFI